MGFYVLYFFGCGGYLYGISGELILFNFFKEYFYNFKCIWIIIVLEGKLVYLRFLEF